MRLLIVILLTGCLTPLERDVKQAQHRAKIAELETRAQDLRHEACSDRLRHKRACNDPDQGHQ